MAAGITDKFTSASNGTRPSPTTLTAIRAIAASSISCGALTGWPTATAVHFVIYTTDTSGNKVAGSQLDCKGIVSGTNITNIVYKAGNDTGNAIGAIVEAAPTAAWADDMVAGISAHANQDGSLITSAVRTALGLDAGTSTGWTVLGFAVSSVVALGQRSYQMVFNGNDLTTTVQPGMRLRMTRTVAAPTQCTSLNGTTQFFSKASPNKLTFTDDFTVSAWIKLTSYAAVEMEIMSRYNGTSGWDLIVNTDGTIYLRGYNGGVGNLSYVSSKQSIPLNKWVHVTAQLDMSAFTATTTTSYIMLDGVDVPAAVGRSGTNPTALIQAGNLEIGSRNGGLQPFPGKIAQVAIYNAKVTQATILASIDRGLAGTETSLASAYSFNNAITDLNTTTPNDLTANGSAVATTADSPFGGQGDGTISSTIEYGIIMAQSFSTNTTLTVQVPEGCAIPTTGGITAVSYSVHKVPFGFPNSRNKWVVQCLGRLAATQATAVASTWYNLGSLKITVPLGDWNLKHSEAIYCINGNGGAKATLSTTSSTESDLDFTAGFGLIVATVTGVGWLNKDKNISLAAATAYFLNVMTNSGNTPTLGLDANWAETVIVAECAHL